MGPKRALTPEQEQTVVSRYLAGEPALAICKSFEVRVHVQTIHNTLRRAGVEVRPELAKKRVADEDRERVAAACLGGATAKEAAALVGTSEETVFRILRARGIRLPKGSPPTCTVDHGAFDEITPESAYWFGFLWADGCVSQDARGSWVLACGLAEKDRGHLEKLRAFLKSTHAIVTVPPGSGSFGGSTVNFHVRSERLCAALTARGFAKKRTRVPAPEIASLRDFWRGAVDGDGWLGTNVQGRYVYPYIGLSGQPPLLETFQIFLHSNALADPQCTLTESGIFKVQITSANAARTIKALYENATVALDRKAERAHEIIAGNLHRFTRYDEDPSHRPATEHIVVSGSE